MQNIIAYEYKIYTYMYACMYIYFFSFNNWIMKKLFIILLWLIIFTLTGCTSNVNNITKDGNVVSEGIDVDLETKNIENLYNILEDIKNDGEADFGDILPVTLEWRADENITNIDWYGISVNNTTKVELVDIEKFFLNSWRLSDLNNMANGTVTTMEWFNKENIWCLVFEQLSDWVDIEKDDIWKNDISIKCGIIK